MVDYVDIAGDRPPCSPSNTFRETLLNDASLNSIYSQTARL